MKLYDYVLERGGRLTLAPIGAPPEGFSSALAAFEGAYEHERQVTRQIAELSRLAANEGDQATATFLLWFITEQVEEEAAVDRIVRKLKLVGDSPSALFILENDLGRRV